MLWKAFTASLVLGMSLRFSMTDCCQFPDEISPSADCVVLWHAEFSACPTARFYSVVIPRVSIIGEGVVLGEFRRNSSIVVSIFFSLLPI